MKTLSYYLWEATHCRTQADAAVTPDVREEFLKTAEVWDRIADARRWLLLCQRGVANR